MLADTCLPTSSGHKHHVRLSPSVPQGSHLQASSATYLLYQSFWEFTLYREPMCHQEKGSCISHGEGTEAEARQTHQRPGRARNQLLCSSLSSSIKRTCGDVPGDTVCDMPPPRMASGGSCYLCYVMFVSFHCWESNQRYNTTDVIHSPLSILFEAVLLSSPG